MTTATLQTSIVTTMERDKDTTGAVKYVEKLHVDATSLTVPVPVSGSFYVKKPHLNRIGNPPKIRITVEPVWD